jgi:hypothetical protein
MQMDINLICKAVNHGNWSFTEHSVRQMRDRRIRAEEVQQAILCGEIIEEYPDDKYSPSCLLHGQTAEGRHIHVVCSLAPIVRIITVYEPNSQEWIDYRQRKNE